MLYKSRLIYRLAMSLLYHGNYTKRGQHLVGMVLDTQPSRVTELCFGDTLVAGLLRRNNIEWTGLDQSKEFVRAARAEGLTATECNIAEAPGFPSADCLVIQGSLYHFHSNAVALVTKMMEAAPICIISEPVENLSGKSSWMSQLAGIVSATQGNPHHFRYTESSLRELIDECINRGICRIDSQDRFAKDLIFRLRRP